MISTAEQWYGSLGAGWRALRFKHVATIVGGQVDPTDDRYSALPLFAPNHMESGTGRLLAVDSAEDQAAESGKYLVADGDVLYSKIRPALRKVVVAPTAGLCSADVYAIRPNRRLLEPRFLFYLLLSEGFAQYSLLESDRVAMPKINREALGECPLVFPALDRQRAIVGFLDAKTANIDALIAKQEQLLALLAEKRQALITQAVTKGLDPNVPMKDSGVDWIGEVPAHWSVAALSTRYQIDLGKMLSPEVANGPYPLPYLGNQHVRWDHVVVDDLPTMSIDPSERERYTLRPGDLLVCEGGEVGRTAMWRGELDVCAYQKALHRLRARNDGDVARYLYFALVTAAGLGVFEAEGNRSTFVHLTSEKLRRHRFPFPPTAEQAKIAEYLDREAGRLDTLSQRVQAMIEKLREYRQALITAAVTGQLDVTSGAAATSAPKPYAEAVGT